MKSQSIPRIHLLYKFITKVNCLDKMYSAFSKAIYEGGESIVIHYQDTSNEVFEESKQSQDQEMAVEESQNGVRKSKLSHVIPELIKYRDNVQIILNSIIKISDSVEHAYAFKKEEKTAFEKICEIKPEIIAEHLAKFMGALLKKPSVSKPDKYTEKQLEALVLVKCIEMFRCIKALDIFEGFYRQELSPRILNK
jgi:hypothetical protein